MVQLFSNFLPFHAHLVPSHSSSIPMVAFQATCRFSGQNPPINPMYHNERVRNKYCTKTPNGGRRFDAGFDDIVYGDCVRERDIMEIPVSGRLFMGHRHVLPIAVHGRPLRFPMVYRPRDQFHGNKCCTNSWRHCLSFHSVLHCYPYLLTLP